MSEDYGSKTDLNIEELSDVTLEIKPDNINDVCNTWELSIKRADLNSIDVKSLFRPLTNTGVGVSYIECLHNSFEAAENLILSTSSTIKQVTEEQVEIGSQYSKIYADNDKKQNNNITDTNKTSIDMNNNNQESTKDSELPINTIEKIDEIKDVDQEKLEINNNFVDKVNSLDTNSYISFMTSLSSIQSNDFLGLIVDEECASTLKKALLSSPNLSIDLKKIISEIKENDVQVSLQSILTDEVNLSKTSQIIIYKYTELLIKNTNIYTSKLSKEAQFFMNVDELFTTYNMLINKTNLQEELLNIYDGVEANENIIEFTRIVVDTISKKNNLTYEDLLCNKANEKMLKEELNNLLKSLSYFKTVSKLGTEAAELMYKTAISLEVL